MTSHYTPFHLWLRIIQPEADNAIANPPFIPTPYDPFPW